MSIKTLTANILSKMQGVNKWQQKFIIHLFPLLLGFRGRMNFANLARQSRWNESSYRNNYSKNFDFMKFNQLLIDEYCSEERIVVLDPSFIRKSGKRTPGLGYFWSGVAGQSKKGLEINGFAVVDIQNNTAMHLFAKQTQSTNKSAENLMDHYISTLTEQAIELQKQSNFLVVDAWFSKHKFVETSISLGFTLISRIRHDAVMFYPYLGPKRKGRGRPKKYAGRVDSHKPDPQYFRQIIQDGDLLAFEGQVWVKSLRRLVKVVLVHRLDKQGETKRVEIYFSTDPTLCGLDVLVYYKARFQIEFLYRDAKQFAGLQDCQSRQLERLHFHFNASLTLVSLAKAAHYLTTPKAERKTFSLSSIRTQYVNELLLDRFFAAFGNIPKPQKNNPQYLNLINFGKIAA